MEDIETKKAIIESILFATGREVKATELMSALELSEKDVISVVDLLKDDLAKKGSGIELIKVGGTSYQLVTKKEYFDYIYPIFDKRSKPNLTPAVLETLSIIAYNPKITRPEIESIRGVNCDGAMYKLLDYDLIEEAGKRQDLPGKPMGFQVTGEFFRLFGFGSLDELPDLPRYKLDENEQIVIDDIVQEAPSPAEGVE